jgi:hypothetical protein
MRRKGTAHLAGIIPVIHSSSEFNMDWHDCLMPIAPGYTAIEHCVYECAMAGCHTIWIIAADDVSPLVRRRLGDFVQDPVFIGRKGRFPSKDRRPIPIFYAPSDSSYNSVAWSIVQGASKAIEISSSISKWLVPEKFYISFPCSVYDVKFLRQHRHSIINEDNVLLSTAGRTVADGEFTAFTFGVDNLRESLVLLNKLENENLFDDQKENIKDTFSLDKIFSRVILIEESEQVELPFYSCIEDWNGYCNYLSSDYSKDIHHPGKLIISYREWNPVGFDN